MCIMLYCYVEFVSGEEEDLKALKIEDRVRSLATWCVDVLPGSNILMSDTFMKSTFSEVAENKCATFTTCNGHIVKRFACINRFVVEQEGEKIVADRSCAFLKTMLKGAWG